MAALTVAKHTPSRNGANNGAPETRSALATDATQFYKGGMLMINTSTGRLIPASTTNADHVVGVAKDDVLTTTDTQVEYLTNAEFLVTGASLVQADVGELVYADDDNLVQDAAAATTGAPAAGYVRQFVSATSAWVAIRQDVNATQAVAT